MTSAVNTRHSDIGGRSSSLKFRISKQHPTPQCVEPMEDLSPSKNRSLPGRLTRSAAAIASNRSLRIDTEQLRSLSIRDTKPPRRRTGSQHPASDIREQQFQKYRELLWTNGRDNLGNKDTPHYKIAPVRLPAASSPSSSYDIITIYTVVHSEGHSPVGLRRQFDRSLLHATVPEPFQSPATPNFDREELLSAIVDTNKSLASRKFRMSKRSSAAKRDPRMRTGSPSPIPAGVPMRKSKNQNTASSSRRPRPTLRLFPRFSIRESPSTSPRLHHDVQAGSFRGHDRVAAATPRGMGRNRRLGLHGRGGAGDAQGAKEH